jgi:hypothetical protein
MLSFSDPAFSIGFTYGPLSNEQYLIENDGRFNLSFYYFTLFIGGIYHKINFSNEIFYYVDLAFDIHNSKMYYYETDNSVNNTTNYLLYLHNDINIYPFKQKWAYMGGGIELIVVDRVFSDAVARSTGYNFYITTNYFCYISGGINIPIGKMEIGLKTLYRLLPFTLNRTVGNGEITFLIGLR